MKKLVETVPNFSEGRDQEKIDAIVKPFKEIEDVKLLDASADKDHNRLVVTAIGTPEAVEKAIYDSTKIAIAEIDMEKHEGEHPRMGAVDVIPFTPVKNIEMEEAKELADRVAKKLSDDFNLPIFMYEESASNEKRRNLAKIRKGQYEGMKEKIKEPEWQPDYGPAEIHSSAGVTAVGARMPLVAFNINLDTNNKEIADKIARKIRHSGGGLRYCKAIGIDLKDKGIAQVSMNMTNYKGTSLYQVMEMVKFEAERFGANIIGSELIGLLPSEALFDVAEYYLKLDDFDLNQVIENRLLEDL
ncbi:glutamate formimidoyltransferase [Halanaerobiaceae bacterium Z-7014]|uniref:glutamate formimidoyltransferase n=1 Tax=Halonatronomonas betaini TaxID=2778430 RepID=A0A931F678_9FIRM|nr:glutamate formimidoyltransferase [Halonatronomonas betaini]